MKPNPNRWPIIYRSQYQRASFLAIAPANMAIATENNTLNAKMPMSGFGKPKALASGEVIIGPQLSKGLMLQLK